jgi:hypothetical protein
MGERVEASVLTLADRGAVAARLARSVAVLDRMIATGLMCAGPPTVGMELELDLVDPLGRPRMVNHAVLDRLGRPDMQEELGQFNIEANLAPRALAGPVLADGERDLAGILATCAAAVEPLGARVISIGTLPTLGADHLTPERISANPRYAVLEDRMRHARRRRFAVHIDGAEPVAFRTDSVVAQAAATSLQLHLLVPPERFADYYNAAQLIAAAQVAVAGNAPYLLGRHVWQETRIALCEQVLDTRRRAEIAAGSPRRVWLGDRWVRGPAELFSDTVRRFPPLLPLVAEEDPDRVLAGGGVPRLAELRLHNGTVWRWNRPVYDVQGGRPHLRIENRVLPSGPTPIDMIANAAFYYGLVRHVADADPPLWRSVPFALAEDDLHRAARHGLSATLRWAGRSLPADRLIRQILLPAAAAGLDAWGIRAADRDRYLGVLADRVRTGRTGAGWQTTAVRLLEQRHGQERPAALREMTRRYLENAATGAPVHQWPLPPGR